MSTALFAGLWGLLAASTLLIGAAVGYLAPLAQRVIATIMAFGAGVLISALAFDLMDAAFARAGYVPTGTGFLGACGAPLRAGPPLLPARCFRCWRPR